MKKTRQGVLDLNHIKSKPAGIRLVMPPLSEEEERERARQFVIYDYDDVDFPTKIRRRR